MTGGREGCSVPGFDATVNHWLSVGVDHDTAAGSDGSRITPGHPPAQNYRRRPQALIEGQVLADRTAPSTRVRQCAKDLSVLVNPK